MTEETDLKKMPLIIKQCFQFLNALGFSLKQKGMFLGGHSHKIHGAVIIPDTIKVMNYPLPWDRLTVIFFPFKNMLSNISTFVCSLVRWKVYKYITRFNSDPTAFPRWVILPRTVTISNFAKRPEIFGITTLASFPIMARNGFIAINTKMFFHSNIITQTVNNYQGGKAL